MATDEHAAATDNMEYEFDPLCSEEAPHQLHFEEVTSAAFKIKSGVMHTPCVKSHLSQVTGMEIFLKKDFLQYTGSFKERGARYALLMLPEDQKKRGVISASLGNHALALCYHGKDLKIPVTVVMPSVAPLMKIQACQQYGATVIIHGEDMGEAKKAALRLSHEKNLTYINGYDHPHIIAVGLEIVEQVSKIDAVVVPVGGGGLIAGVALAVKYDHPHIIAGQGTVGLEIVEQVSKIDAVVVPVGGGGLIAGVALAVKSMYPDIKIIGVESEKCASFSNALKSNKPVYTPIQPTLADGLAVPKVGYNAFATAAPLIDKMVVVKEEWIAVAILRLVELEKCVVEGAGAVGLAAILAGHLPEYKGKRIVLLLCGGNIDTTILGRCLERGLAADGRLVKFSVTVSDRPGGIAELCRILVKLGVSIKDIIHERAWLTADIFSVRVKVVCETRDMQHANQLRETLYKNYEEVVFGDIRTAGLSES